MAKIYTEIANRRRPPEPRAPVIPGIEACDSSRRTEALFLSTELPKRIVISRGRRLPIAPEFACHLFAVFGRPT